MKSKNLILKIVYSACLVCAALLLIVLTLNLLNRPISTTYSTLYNLIEQKNVQNIVISDKEITFSDLTGLKYIIYRISSDNVTDRLFAYSQTYTILENKPSYIPIIILLLVISIVAFLFSLRKSETKKIKRNIENFIINDSVPNNKNSMRFGYSRTTSLYSQEDSELIDEITSEEQKPQEVKDEKETKKEKEDTKAVRDEENIRLREEKIKERREAKRRRRAVKENSEDEAFLQEAKEDMMLANDDKAYNTAEQSAIDYFSSTMDSYNENKKPSKKSDDSKNENTSGRKSNFTKKPNTERKIGHYREKKTTQEVSQDDSESFYEKQRRGEI